MKSTIASVGAFAMVALFIGCDRSSVSADASQRQAKVQRVIFADAIEEEITDYVELVGRLKADKSVSIRSRVSGFLEKTHFTDGQTVEAGDLLFSIEPDEYQAVYDQAKAQIEVAEAQLDLATKKLARSDKLIQSQAMSVEEYEQNKSSVAEAAARLIAMKADAERVRLDVDYTKVITPITGRVDRALLDEGNFVTGGLTGGSVLANVVSIHPIKAVANVDESVRLKFMRRQREVAGDDFKQADKLSELQIPCWLQLQDETGFPHEGTLEYGEIQVDATTGTSRLRAVFDNVDGLLTPGMFVRLKLPVSTPHQAVLIPDTAIGTDQATKFVYVIDDQKQIEFRSVEIGDRRDKDRVVLSGLQPGESVVIKGMQLVQPGMTVEPIANSSE
ncbi:efflux RND transporter periplasmic adaptor subunit [Rhodopirellula sp. MGV]|uniref:efflux RND transporter periplasmic adaptor subunit n=1 Tax=Rhodopirellula sp. MGV TaxID=2023130 RepID=UPI000BD29489|nr:efflux RND transporter periplasmic adaptor subunit [Rhodopirellula sp. MGV]OYP35197.1 hypothetical protein CGZ80_12420 [Rhodopirellula sp. MGV]